MVIYRYYSIFMKTVVLGMGMSIIALLDVGVKMSYNTYRKTNVQQNKFKIIDTFIAGEKIEIEIYC